MTSEIAELRDLNLELESLKARKDAIKKHLQEHRDTITDTQLAEQTQEARQIKTDIEATERKIKEVQERAKQLNDKKEFKNYMENGKMERADIIASAEYRSAFFKRLQGKELNEEEQRSMTSATGSVGAAIPTKTMDMILGQMTEKATLLGDVTVFNIPELLSIPKENVTNDASWIQEDADSTNVDDSLTNITLSAYKLMRTIKITAKVSAMSIDAFETWIVSTMTKKMTKAIENAIVNGAGAGSNQPTGLMTGITWNTTAGATQNAIEIANGTQYSYDNFVDAETLIDEDYVSSAVYYMNRKTLAQVRKLKDDNKRPLFERAVEDGFRGNLNGLPVKVSKYIPDGVIFVGDLKSAYVLNFASPIEFAMSKEAGFMSGATVYRSLALLDGKPTGVANALVKMSIAAE